MAKRNRVIDIKKRKLKFELSKENPDKNIVNRLRKSVKRNRNIAGKIRKFQKAKRLERKIYHN